MPSIHRCNSKFLKRTRIRNTIPADHEGIPEQPQHVRARGIGRIRLAAVDARSHPDRRRYGPQSHRRARNTPTLRRATGSQRPLGAKTSAGCAPTITASWIHHLIANVRWPPDPTRVRRSPREPSARSATTQTGRSHRGHSVSSPSASTPRCVRLRSRSLVVAPMAPMVARDPVLPLVPTCSAKNGAVLGCIHP